MQRSALAGRERDFPVLNFPVFCAQFGRSPEKQRITLSLFDGLPGARTRHGTGQNECVEVPGGQCESAETHAPRSEIPIAKTAIQSRIQKKVLQPLVMPFAIALPYWTGGCAYWNGCAPPKPWTG